MRKRIPSCPWYIDDQNNFYDEHQCLVELHIQHNSVFLTLNGVSKWWDIQFVKLFTLFEMPSYVDPDNVRFLPQYHKHRRCDWIPKFIQPISFILDQEYRVVASYPTVAVSKDAQIIDIATKQKLRIHHCHPYPRVVVYDPVTETTQSVTVHRLVAQAWVYYKQDAKHPFVDHIDDNTSNNHADNLQWVTVLENYKYSEFTRLALRDDIGMVRNIFTGEISYFKNMTEFSNITKAAKIAIRQYAINFLVLQTYEVRFRGDDRPWFFADPRVKNKETGRMIFTVTYPDGTEEIYSGAKAFKAAFDVDHNSHVHINITLKHFKEKYPELDVKMEDMCTFGVIQVLELKTNVIREYDSREKVREATGISVDNLNDALDTEGRRQVNGFCYRFKTNQPWPEVRPISKWIPVTVTDKESNEVYVFSGIAEAERTLNIDRHLLLRMIRRPFDTDRYTVTRKEPDTPRSSAGENPA